MADYYSKEALMEARQSTWCDMYDLEEFLTEVPIAEVEEVRHGEWKPSVYCQGYWLCSECGYVWERKSIYCPNCGAKMDGGKAE